MIYLLLITIILAFISSFFCCLAESSILSVAPAHVKVLVDQGKRGAPALALLKEDVERPITAILILNTIANTGGASLAGAIVGELWGDMGLLAFSISFTVAIIFFAEAAPKILGVAYAKQLAPALAIPVTILVRIFSPLIILSSLLSRRLQKGEDPQTVSHQEVLSMAAIGTEEGSLDQLEGSVISNVIGLDKLLVRDLMTPRVAVFRVPENLSLAELEQALPDWEHTRVPLYSSEDPEHLSSYVRQRDIYRELVRGNKQIVLKSMARPLAAVPELARVDKILLGMFKGKDHICTVVDEHGGLAGIITMEDILEEVVGHEISDEYDLDQSTNAQD